MVESWAVTQGIGSSSMRWRRRAASCSSSRSGGTASIRIGVVDGTSRLLADMPVHGTSIPYEPYAWRDRGWAVAFGGVPPGAVRAEVRNDDGDIFPAKILPLPAELATDDRAAWGLIDRWQYECPLVCFDEENRHLTTIGDFAVRPRTSIGEGDDPIGGHWRHVDLASPVRTDAQCQLCLGTERWRDREAPRPRVRFQRAWPPGVPRTPAMGGGGSGVFRSGARGGEDGGRHEAGLRSPRPESRVRPLQGLRGLLRERARPALGDGVRHGR